MIRSFLRRVFGSRGARPEVRKVPEIIPRDRHGIGRDRISACALRVTSTLQDNGYKAFVVGGAVRDLLIGRAPKDFDVATDATPEQAAAAEDAPQEGANHEGRLLPSSDKGR